MISKFAAEEARVNSQRVRANLTQSRQQLQANKDLLAKQLLEAQWTVIAFQDLFGWHWYVLELASFLRVQSSESKHVRQML